MIRRLFAALSVVCVLTLPASAANVKPFEMLGADISEKSGDQTFGRIIIQVDSNDPQEIIASASLAAHRLINDNTLDAIQLFAYGKDFPGSFKYETATITFARDRKFMGWKDWSYSLAPDRDSIPQRISFDHASVFYVSPFPNPRDIIMQNCIAPWKCSFGRTDLY